MHIKGGKRIGLQPRHEWLVWDNFEPKSTGARVCVRTPFLKGTGFSPYIKPAKSFGL
jgi:hypothetical protein